MVNIQKKTTAGKITDKYVDFTVNQLSELPSMSGRITLSGALKGCEVHGLKRSRRQKERVWEVR